MKCKECQNSIDDFIKDNLDRRAASNFALHIRECKECHDELEINYCMQAAITELTSDVDATSDFMSRMESLLDNAVEDYRLYMHRLHIKRILIAIGFTIISLYIGLC